MIVPDLSTALLVGLLVAAQRRGPDTGPGRAAEAPADSAGRPAGPQCPCWACAGYPIPGPGPAAPGPQAPGAGWPPADNRGYWAGVSGVRSGP